MPLRFPTTTDLLGAHVSTAGGTHTAFERGAKIGANAIALFTKNSNQWNARGLDAKAVAAFRDAHRASGIGPAIAHASYLINLAAPDDALWEKSIGAMVVELERAELLGVQAVVLHPGAHVGEGVDKGIDRIARALDRVRAALPAATVFTLLETSAGQGSSLGCAFEELGRMLRLVDDRSRLGVCVDTCHVFAAGYDIRTKKGWERATDELLEHVDERLVGAFHLNDSKRELGSRVDRHEHIGKGHIGRDAFAFVINDPRFKGVPKVLETPKPTEFDADIENLGILRSMLASKRSRAAKRPKAR
jgi:deoxyribonuclease-4